MRLTEFVTRAMTNLMSVTDRISTALTTVVDTIQTAINGLIERIRSGITRVIDRAVAAIRNVPSIVWELISGIVNRAANAVRRVVNVVANAVQRILNSIFDAIRNMIQAVRDAVVSLIERLLSALLNVINRIITLIQNTIDRVVNAIQRGIAWVRRTIRRIVQGVMRAVMRAAKLIIENWLRPQLEAARAKARAAYEEFQRVLPQLRQLAEETKQRMERSLDRGVEQMTSLGGDAIDSLLNPDGDHFAIGEEISVSGFVGAGAVVGADISGSFVFDFVADYAHNQIGIFNTIDIQRRRSRRRRHTQTRPPMSASRSVGAPSTTWPRRAVQVRTSRLLSAATTPRSASGPAATCTRGSVSGCRPATASR